jgi:sugar-specific transcriptional regulator TrmB
MGKLPIGINTVISQKRIDKKINELITSSENCLYILTHRFTTIQKHIGAIREFRKKGDVVLKIIGEEPDNEEVAKLVKQLDSEGIKICFREFEKIRIIMSDEKRVMISYGTGSYEGSHVGLNSDHKAAISLFKSYIDSLCHSCGESCESKCQYNSEELT